MKILTVGDVVGLRAVEYLKEKLWAIRQKEGVDMVVVNGENACDIHGISRAVAEDIIAAGADVITLGNHAFGKKDIYEALNDRNDIIRPANYPPFVPGAGHTLIDAGGRRILCINVLGTAFMEPLACPIATVEKILCSEKGRYDLSVLDVHAESTSEKYAIARYFDGKIDIIFGTHTHVPTADEQILPKGTAYITDIGMTGPIDSVIGADTDTVIERMKTHIPTHFKVAVSDVRASGAIFEYDTGRLKVVSVRRIKF